MSNGEHWLVRPQTVRLLRRISLVVLALSVLAEALVAHEPVFAIEGVFGFGAWYGFLACGALILAAKGIGALLKRADTYYAGDGND